MADETRGTDGGRRTAKKKLRPRPRKKTSRARKTVARRPDQSEAQGRGTAGVLAELESEGLIRGLTHLTTEALMFGAKEVSARLGRALLSTPEREKLMKEGGQTLRDLREVAGLTLSDLSEAADIKDGKLLAAVEAGTATLSFDLILRLSSVLARHDPVPFIVKFTRTYNPDVWRFLEAWGVGQIPVQFEREREFINIYRRHDAARDLDDEAFQRVLEFTRAAFEMALYFSRTGGGTPPGDADADHEETRK